MTPRFYDPVATAGTRYSFTGALTKPRQVLPGGYISFVNEETDELQQILYLGDAPVLKTLGSAEGAVSVRQWIDNKMDLDHRDELHKILRSMTDARTKELRDRRSTLDKVAELRAARM
jgi:hypothetical protein